MTAPVVDATVGTAPARLTLADVVQATETQVRVIRALILRETKARYGEHKMGFLWALAEPVMMVSVFVTFFAIMNSATVSNMPIVPFMITGILPFSMFKDTMAQMQGAITTNRSLLGFPQVTTFDVIIARGLLDTAVLMCVFPLMLFGAKLLGFDWEIEDPLGVLFVMVLLAMCGMGLGFFFASVSPVVPSLRQVGTVVFGRPLFLTSGLFFVAESIPQPYRDYALFNPLLHMMELMRDRFFYEFETDHGSWTYAITCAVSLFTVGLLTHQALRKRAVIGL